MLSWSKYNVLLHSEPLARYFLYNTCHTSVFELDKDEYDEFRKISEQKVPVASLPPGTLKILQENHILTRSDRLEFLKHKTGLQARRFDKTRMQLILSPEENTMDVTILHGILNFIKIHHPETLHILWRCKILKNAIPAISRLDTLVKMLNIKSYISGIITAGEYLGSQDIQNIQEIAHSIKIIVPEISPDKQAEETEALSGKIEQLLSCGITVHCAIHAGNSLMEQHLNKAFSNYQFTAGATSACNDLPSGLPVKLANECLARHVNSFIIDNNGFVYKCWLDFKQKNNPVTHVIDNSNNRTDLYVRYISDKDYLDDPECQACRFVFLCNGGCPHPKIHNNSRHICSLNERSLLNKIETHYEKEYRSGK